MGKKRDREYKESGDRGDQHAGDTVMETVKKSKKHKHKKSSKKEEVERIINVEDVEDMDISVDDVEDSPSQTLKLKIKISDSSPDKMNTPKGVKVKPEKSKSSSSSKKSSKKKDGKGEDDTDSEEERWLDAIESGKLEEVDDELKRMKNPRLMTARQRAMMEKEKKSDGTDDTFPVIPAEPLLSLPSGFKEKVVTKEMLAKKAIKTQKRREQAQEKREEDKKKTVDRLLKKQDSKVAKISRMRSSKKAIPMFSYVNNRDGVGLSVPTSYSFPMEVQTEKQAPVARLCGAPGCHNPRKYSCSKTGVSLCSLQCFKTNLASHKLLVEAV